jgi:formylglycine-generating enzyme required for sulfatase activity
LSGRRFPWGDTISWSEANYYAYPSNYTYDANPVRGFDPTFNDGVFPYTSPVDHFPPNGYGLYDVAGNVGQWCWDWYGSYPGASQTDPRGPASGLYRLVRGGSYVVPAGICRNADRGNGGPADEDDAIGFRSALPPNH